MKNLRIGIGFDIHRFKKGRKLVLGGVEIPYKFGLDGHSDADVLLHALCDAILGAMARPDIGEHFSDKDPRYKNISSMILLKKVKDIMQKYGFQPVNVDCIVITDEPRINTFRNKIKTNIKKALCLDIDCIGLKAKTTEGVLSFSKKGIAAYCVVLLEKKK
ncbi:MAG: 2-C-methyl-D-erythritol 2,4-cyclodiphosphate synthase [Candidatus Omnitrophica bacterium]|nr:2-C-methyl-D-erythritol 2,4-cyclodiphosphate synthase [Candidatus Omnitrophota bacterium]MDD5351935.1 2-C-methyl-D-erythritol 2,4-cyclodiphosphate synthase [Candidatus Omnitrophota bacterium]MDD5550761.1 2-C-methyl-D-erythritol 2,4-cyclodiphosphate synthase [Candidatus Omnitrophota bacterium]